MIGLLGVESARNASCCVRVLRSRTFFMSKLFQVDVNQFRIITLEDVEDAAWDYSERASIAADCPW